MVLSTLELVTKFLKKKNTTLEIEWKIVLSDITLTKLYPSDELQLIK